MAFQPGYKAQVFYGGYDVSAYLNSAGLTIDVETGDTTTFGATNYKTALVTLTGSTLTCAGYFDPAEDVILAAAAGTTSGVATYAPAGARTVGDPVRILPVVTTSYAHSGAIADIAAFSWDLLAEAAIAVGTILHPLGEDTNTTTGATYDGTAATTTGWTAALHVTDVDAGSWVCTLEDASASNFSDGASVTGGAFTAATGITSQRLTSAAGATLRRYVRYVMTRTGGAGGDGVTFALSIARSV